jgi:hypothetical protein
MPEQPSKSEKTSNLEIQQQGLGNKIAESKNKQNATAKGLITLGKSMNFNKQQFLDMGLTEEDLAEEFPDESAQEEKPITPSVGPALEEPSEHTGAQQIEAAIPIEKQAPEADLNPKDPQVLENPFQTKETNSNREEKQQQLALLLEDQERLEQGLENLRLAKESLNQELIESLKFEAAQSQTAETPIENNTPSQPIGDFDIENASQDDLRKEYWRLDEIKDSIPSWKLWKYAKMYKLDKKQKEIRQKIEDVERQELSARDKTPEERIRLLSKHINKLTTEKSKLGFLHGNKKEDLEDEILTLQDDKKSMEEILVDREKKPFWYYAAEKITDPNIVSCVKNRDGTAYDLRWLDSDRGGYERRTHGQFINNDEAIFEFNALGFALVLKNIAEVRGENGIEIYSPKTIYKLLGPDGKIIADDMHGYDDADSVYTKTVDQYRARVEEEFKQKNIT